MTPEEFCKLHDACEDGYNFALKFDSMAEVWDNCERLDWIFWIQKRIKNKKFNTRFRKQLVKIYLEINPQVYKYPKEIIQDFLNYALKPTRKNRIKICNGFRILQQREREFYGCAVYKDIENFFYLYNAIPYSIISSKGSIRKIIVETLKGACNPFN